MMWINLITNIWTTNLISHFKTANFLGLSQKALDMTRFTRTIEIRRNANFESFEDAFVHADNFGIICTHSWGNHYL